MCVLSTCMIVYLYDSYIYLCAFRYRCYLGRWQIANNMLDEAYERTKAEVDEILTKSKCVIVGIDGWTDGKGDQLKIATLKPAEYPVTFFSRATPAGSKRQTAEEYFEALKVDLTSTVMKVENAVHDFPSTMEATRKLMAKHYPGKTDAPCQFHGVDLAAPVKSSSIRQALRDSKKVIKFFKGRGVPRGVLDRVRTNKNKLERKEASADGRKPKLVPTLQVRTALFRPIGVNAL